MDVLCVWNWMKVLKILHMSVLPSWNFPLARFFTAEIGLWWSQFDSRWFKATPGSPREACLFPLVCLCLTWLAGALSHNALSPLTHQTVAVPAGRAPAQITTRQLIELFFSSQAGGHCKNIPTLEYGFLVQVLTRFELHNNKSIQISTHTWTNSIFPQARNGFNSCYCVNEPLTRTAKSCAWFTRQRRRFVINLPESSVMCDIIVETSRFTHLCVCDVKSNRFWNMNVDCEDV